MGAFIGRVRTPPMKHSRATAAKAFRQSLPPCSSITNRGSPSPAVKSPVSSKAVVFDRQGGIKGLFRTDGGVGDTVDNQSGPAGCDLNFRISTSNLLPPE
jgi:hypothetical protein